MGCRWRAPSKAPLWQDRVVKAQWPYLVHMLPAVGGAAAEPAETEPAEAEPVETAPAETAENALDTAEAMSGAGENWADAMLQVGDAPAAGVDASAVDHKTQEQDPGAVVVIADMPEVAAVAAAVH